jgi:hypothetical protein
MNLFSKFILDKENLACAKPLARADALVALRVYLPKTYTPLI